MAREEEVRVEERRGKGREYVAVERRGAPETCLVVRKVEERRRLRKGERSVERFPHRNVKFA